MPIKRKKTAKKPVTATVDESSNVIDDEYKKAKRKQSWSRQTFDDAYQELVDAIKQKDKNYDLVEGLLSILEAEEVSLMSADETVMSLMNDNSIPDEECEQEVKDIRSYRRKSTLLIKQVKKMVTSHEDVESTASNSKQHHRLPKLELPKFGGEAKDWLQFWSQFETIHHNESISAAVKFQYLAQCMKDNTTAKEIVTSYPITESNYPLVVTNLKERFGKEDVLVEIYIRDLIGLILENSQNRKYGTEFSSLFVRLSAQLRALSTIGVTTDKCALILYPMVKSCLPEDILLTWERSRIQSVTNPQTTSEDLLESLIEFLKQEVAGKEQIRLARNGFTSSNNKKEDKTSRKSEIPTAAGLLSAESNEKPGHSKNCIFCGKNSHNSEACFKVSSMTTEQKRHAIYENKRCFKCLRSGHLAKMCKANIRCILCNKKGHFAILCPDNDDKKSSQDKPVTDIEDKKSSSVQMSNEVKSSEVLLQTLLVKVIGKNGEKTVRALVDTGSQKSYILDTTAHEVGLPLVGQEEVVHLLFGGSVTKPCKYERYKLQISDLNSNFLCHFDVSGIAKISQSIKGIPDGPWLSELKQRGIEVSDVNNSKEIEVLIGSDVAGNLITGKKFKLPSGPIAIQTKVGWTLMGKLFTPTPLTENAVKSSSIKTTIMMNLEEVKNLWDLDVIGITDPIERKTREELEVAAMAHFKDTVSRTEDGRYEVHLPWVEGHTPLASNKHIAEARLVAATKNLRKDGTLGQYQEVFETWEKDGIIEEVSEPEVTPYGYYLPHRPVYKPESLTTPIRPVFDASARSKGNPSLNDCLEKGPNLLEQVPVILHRFRFDNVGVISDVKKAFLQMNVVNEHRNFMRFLWWKNMDCTTMKIYRHRRVVFGVSSSPFLLGATIQHHLESWKPRYEETVKKLEESFYVDNCVASVSSMEAALKFKTESEEIMIDGKFDLRGWEFGPKVEDKVVPVLGMLWNIKKDTLSIDMKKFKNDCEEVITKRKILSTVNGIYDPVGTLAAFTITPKIILQQAWKLKTGWDSPLPEDIAKAYRKWRDQLKYVSAVEVPRRITQNGGRDENLQLHVFSDASGSSYATCVYLRSVINEAVSVKFIEAKSRVAPLKSLTIPRLELLGCLIGARLGITVLKTLKLNVPVHFWTDSTTALSWIKTDGIWGAFVNNRVKEIVHLTEGAIWHHVPGDLNPADLPSRGCSISTLIERRWGEGPSWLKLPEDGWPNSNYKINHLEVDKEKKRTVVSSLVTEDYVMQTLLRYSNYNKIVRVVALIVRRFYCNLMNAVRQKNGNPQFIKFVGKLETREIEDAEVTVLKYVQKSAFTGINDPKIKTLRPFLDENGVVRVKTRLVMGDFEDDFKFPIILPDKHEMVERLIWSAHQNTSHGGIQFLRSHLREWYWILNSRRSIRSVINKCIKCRRYLARKIEVPEPPLPKSRVTPTSPFNVTGMDLFGPLFIRGNRKVWVALFTCANYRAVHLEITSTMSTGGFLKCLRRFVARRGRPNTIYSDNGTNFVGANNLFKKVDWDEVQKYASVNRIHWVHNVVTGAWWGGWWESLIRIVKRMLLAVLDKKRVNYEELETLLCDVESTVNGRPLTYISENPGDLLPLTPAQFLRDGCLAVPEVDVVESTMLGKQYQYIQKLREDLRSRFRKDYLSEIKHAGKQKKFKELKVGDLVLVENDMKKRLDWPVGVVKELIPGKDGVVRVAKLKTNTGEMARPVQRIFPLELNENTFSQNK